MKTKTAGNKKPTIPKLGKGLVHKPKAMGRKSPIVMEQAKAQKGAAGSSELKGMQKMFGITKPPRKKKIMAAEKKMKNQSRYESSVM